jgi:DNA-binding protein HU-beta
VFYSKKTLINFCKTAKKRIFATRNEKEHIYNNKKRYNDMTKADIVKQISDMTGLPKAEVLVVVEAFMSTIKGVMLNGENVYLRGFGSFVLKHRAKKTARNIKQNTTISIPAHDFPTFKPAKEFADEVSEKTKH